MCGLLKEQLFKQNNENIFSVYTEKESIFKNKNILDSSFIPEKIEHRSNEIKQITSALAPVLRGYKPSNMFIYGGCGTGKTISIKFILKQLEEISKTLKKPINVIYINSKMSKVADTEYRLFAQFLKNMGVSVPDTGLPTNVIYRKFFEKIDEKEQFVVIVLDEIDSLFKKIGDEFLYNLTRANTELKKARISLIGITNDLSFREGLDMRVKSSLSEEEILFRPYNAMQIRDILMSRASESFSEGVISESVINKCAAIAAQEHGDARRALDLLRVAGEIVERMGFDHIEEENVDMAQEKIDLDRVTEAVKIQPAHSQLILQSIIKLDEKNKSNNKWADKRLLTGDVFSYYETSCRTNGIKTLTQRRVSDLINELDMLGIITSKIISKGRHGRSREISLAIHNGVLDNVKRILLERFGN